MAQPGTIGKNDEDDNHDHYHLLQYCFLSTKNQHKRMDQVLTIVHVTMCCLSLTHTLTLDGLRPMQLQDRLTTLFSKTKTPECRALIAEHMGYFVNALATEVGLPFTDFELQNECPEEVYDLENLPEGMHLGHIQNRTYQPEDGEYVDADDLTLCYGILTHEDPASTIRLIEALYEPGHSFVVHVDGKEMSDETHRVLTAYAKSSGKEHVHVLPDPYRVRVNWGGFNMVNATIQILQYALAVETTNREPLHFHKFVHIASTSYPLVSNVRIRQTIASYPVDANMMHVIMKPTDPYPGSWHYFVECDDAVHRIYRLSPLTSATNGADVYTTSQWFIASRQFAQYLADQRPGTFSRDFLDYLKHVVVADEAYFGTVLRNTAFCTTHHNWNFLHLLFDRYVEQLQTRDGACALRGSLWFRLLDTD